MTEICPRFGKWFGGCRFEARYDEVKQRSQFDSVFGSTSWSIEMVPGSDGKKAHLKENAPTDKRTYVRDICRTCGKTIERVKPC